MTPENIKLKTLEMTFEGPEEFRGNANQIRGFFASKFNEGAEILKGLFDKFDTVTLPHQNFEITERSLRLKKQDSA